MDRTGLSLFLTAFGNSLWLQLWRNLSSRNWAGASRRVCSLSGAQTYCNGLIRVGFSISFGEKKEVSCELVLRTERQRHNKANNFITWTPTMSLGLTRNSLFLPPTGMCFFIRKKLLKRHSNKPLLSTLRLKSTSSQPYLHGTGTSGNDDNAHLRPTDSHGLLWAYRFRSYWTFCVRSTFSMTKSWRWHRLKGLLGDLRARLLLHLRVPHTAYWEILGVFSMCCSTVFRDTLLRHEPPSDVSLRNQEGRAILHILNICKIDFEQGLVNHSNQLHSYTWEALITFLLLIGGRSTAHRSRPSWQWKAIRLASWHLAPPVGSSPARGYGMTALWSRSEPHLKADRIVFVRLLLKIWLKLMHL